MVYRFLDLQRERLRVKDDAVTTNFELLKRQSRTIGRSETTTRRGKLCLTDQATAYL